MKNTLISKDIILEAARTEFIEKGFDGARMQEIANRAGINKALLHYYFSSKEKLFEEIFKEAFQQFAPQLQNEIANYSSIRGFLRAFLNIYVSMLVNRPYLPIFILSELHRNPGRPAQLIRNSGIDPEKIVELVQKEMEDGVLIKMNPREFIVNVLSLAIFPFAARPMLQRILWNSDEVEYEEFLKSRVDSIFTFIEPLVFVK